VHRQQFDGGHAEVDEMRDGRFVAQSGEGPAQLSRNPGVAHGEALDVYLVDDRVCVGVTPVGPVQPRDWLTGRHQAARHAGRGVRVARCVLVAGQVSKHRRAERDGPAQGPKTVAPSGKWLPGSVSVVIMAVAVMV
jgi:hypothetical protein